MDPNPQKPAEKAKAPTLYLIAGAKLAKGLLLILIAAGIFSLARNDDLQDSFDKFIAWIHLDPENRFFGNIGDWLQTVTPGNVRDTAFATGLYGIFLLVGGTGLAIRAKWAIWLTIGESAFFIPIEILELTRRPRPEGAPDELVPAPQVHHFFTHPKYGLAVILALNILIVWYLLKNRERLFRH